MFRKYFDRKKAEKRREKLMSLSEGLKPVALMKYRSVWPKTPYSKSDDSHEAGFIQGYAFREDEVHRLKQNNECLETLVQDFSKEH